MLASVPLSPVTSFSKKREGAPTFFAEGIAGMENPPSPSRVSRDSINSSNSGSDSETPPHTTNGAINGQAMSSSSSQNNHRPVLRATNSVPGSTIQHMNGTYLYQVD